MVDSETVVAVAVPRELPRLRVVSTPCIYPARIQKPLEADGMGDGAAFAIDIEGCVEIADDSASLVDVFCGEGFEAFPKIPLVPAFGLVGDVGSEDKEIEFGQATGEPAVLALRGGVCFDFGYAVLGEDTESVLVCRRVGRELVGVMGFEWLAEVFSGGGSIFGENDEIGALF